MQVSLHNVAVHDGIQGTINGRAWDTIENISIWRRDGIPTYPLAVVVDDNIMGITDIIRGFDLATNTAQQLFLMDKLGWKRPRYAHVPVVTDRQGEKLSKRDEATTIDNRHARQNLIWSMQLLGLDPPQRMTLDELLSWGIEHWSRCRISSEASLSGFVSI